jgi:transposase InsO family protein
VRVVRHRDVPGVGGVPVGVLRLAGPRAVASRVGRPRAGPIEIEAIWIASGETYGVPRMTAWLVKQGFEVNHKRVARIMRELGIEGESGRRRVRTTIVDKGATAADDHVKP